MELGLADRGFWQDLNFYFLTEKGEEVFRSWYVKTVQYRKPADRDLEYLKGRINALCGYYYFKFGSDNAGHVISAYLNYWVKGHRVSHTTEQVIRKFLSELNSYRKRGLLA